MRIILSSKIPHEAHLVFVNEFYILPHIGKGDSNSKKRKGFFLNWLCFSAVIVLINKKPSTTK